MEKNWERTVPFFYIDRETVFSLFEGIVKKEHIVDINLVNEGCRTSNYIISTIDNKKYVLKIFSENEQQYKKECKILNILKNSIPVQEICKFDKSTKIGDRYYVIYRYLRGKTLSQSLNNKDTISEKIIRDAADILANIHKLKFKSIGFFDEDLYVNYKLKPLNQWYDDFITDRVERRLGKEITHNIRLLIKDNIEELLQMDKDSRLVHGDFQGTNILVKNNKISGIIDWEFAMAGHPLADIGQFFRYEEYFDKKSILIFEDEYRKKSDYILPKDWYRLCKIRDLSNLIQLMGYEEDMPNKYAEIKSLIFKTIKMSKRKLE